MLQGNRKDWKKAGVYCITCIVNNKKYIGCSKNIYSRINNHKYSLEKQSLKQENQYFIDDFKKYGYEKFNYEVLEYTSKNLKDKEFYYINLYDTINREKEYNLRRDNSKNSMIPLEETRKKYSKAQRERFSKKEERNKIGKRSSKFWKENPNIKECMADKVSKTLTKYKILQYTKNGEFIKEWDRVKDIIKENPTYKVHNIYAVCSGEKPSIYGYIWKKYRI